MKKLKHLASFILALIVIFGCQKDEYTEIVGVCPIIVSTIPLDKAVNVPLNQVVSATFNEKMNPETITDESFQLLQGETKIAGTISYNNVSASFAPSSPLLPFTLYTGRVKTMVKDLMGNALQEDYVWTFTTIPEVALSSLPAEGGTTSGAGTFNQGSIVTVIATPNPGYSFVSWTENGTVVSTNPAYQFTMAGNRALVANFTLQHVLALSSNPVLGGTTSGSGIYDTGTNVTATAFPLGQYNFVNWTENSTIVSTEAIYPFQLNASRTLVANFALKTYTLNVEAINGTVAKNPNLTAYNSGSEVELTATPNEGFTFTGWSGDATGSLNPLSVTMNSNKNITANFTAIIKTYTLNVQAVNGTVVKDPNLTAYNSGAVVKLTATPNEGFTFTGWSGDTTGSVNPLSLTMNSDKNITANFTAIIKTYTLNVQAVNGTVVKDPNLTDYNSGAVVKLTATPNEGFTFTGWSGDATGSVNPLSLTMNSDKNITANFTATVNTYTLNVQAVNGTVVKNLNLTDYNSGAIVELTATPNDGFTFTGWSGDATGSLNPLSLTMNSNKNITANFTATVNTYTLNVQAVNGTVVKDPNLTAYNSGAIVALTATPNEGFTFTGWSGDATGSLNPLSVTMNSNKNITANFTATVTTYTLNVQAVNGTVVKDPNLTAYNSGAVVKLTATPNEGFTFTGWSGDATGSVNPLSLTMNSDKNITANFTATVNTYTLNVQAVNGTVVKNPNLTDYNSGAIVELTATPNDGFTFTGWSGDATGSVNPLSVTMNTNKNITANFTAVVNTYTLNVQAENGTVVKNPNLTAYNSGALVVLTATPKTGYEFTSWSGDTTGITNPFTVKMNSNKNITANFTAIVNTYKLNVLAVNGSVVKNPNLTDYNSGAIVELTATPNEGFTFTGWSGDATGSLNPLSVTMNSNKNITANFIATVNTYTLNVQAVNGAVVKNPDLAEYDDGATVELTATPDNGFKFDSWSGDASGNLLTTTVIMNANKNVTANFIALPPIGPAAIDLGAAGNFSILTMSGISSTGITAVGGNIGVSPAAATAITGFGLIMDTNGQSSHTTIATHVTGKVYASDYAAPTPSNLTVAVANMLTAYTTANNLVTPAPVLEKGAGDLSGLTLAPGLYKWGTGVLIADGASVTLSGGANDTWVFQIAQDLTLNSSAQVNLIGGAQAKNITWVVAGQAVLGTNTVLYGNILSKTLISLNTGSKVTGKLLAQTAVTLNTSTVVEP